MGLKPTSWDTKAGIAQGQILRPFLSSILMTLMCVTQVMDYKHMLTQFYLHGCSQTNKLLGPGGTLLTNSFFVFPVTNTMESFWFNNDGQMHKKN